MQNWRQLFTVHVPTSFIFQQGYLNTLGRCIYDQLLWSSVQMF